MSAGQACAFVTNVLQHQHTGSDRLFTGGQGGVEESRKTGDAEPRHIPSSLLSMKAQQEAVRTS